MRRMMDKKKYEEENKHELHSDGVLPDPEEMKLYDTRKKEEKPATNKNKQDNADDRSGYDYRRNK